MNAARHIMCEAYKAKMTQKQGFVWFLPGWFEKDWYDIDSLAKNKRRRQTGRKNISKRGEEHIKQRKHNVD